MYSQRVRGLALCGLVLAGCATVRPSFERRFDAGPASLDLWMNLLAVRYACDTVVVHARSTQRGPTVGLSSLSAGAPSQGIRVGMSACDLATLVSPETVRAWRGDERGIREEWQYRPTSGPLVTVYLEGPAEQGLLVVAPLPQATGGARRYRIR